MLHGGCGDPLGLVDSFWPQPDEQRAAAITRLLEEEGFSAASTGVAPSATGGYGSFSTMDMAVGRGRNKCGRKRAVMLSGVEGDGRVQENVALCARSSSCAPTSQIGPVVGTAIALVAPSVGKPLHANGSKLRSARSGSRSSSLGVFVFLARTDAEQEELYSAEPVARQRLRRRVHPYYHVRRVLLSRRLQSTAS